MDVNRSMPASPYGASGGNLSPASARRPAVLPQGAAAGADQSFDRRVDQSGEQEGAKATTLPVVARVNAPGAVDGALDGEFLAARRASVTAEAGPGRDEVSFTSRRAGRTGLDGAIAKPLETRITDLFLANTSQRLLSGDARGVLIDERV